MSRARLRNRLERLERARAPDVSRGILKVVLIQKLNELARDPERFHRFAVRMNRERPGEVTDHLLRMSEGLRRKQAQFRRKGSSSNGLDSSPA
jgi:hypothetical protein